VMII